MRRIIIYIIKSEQFCLK